MMDEPKRHDENARQQSHAATESWQPPTTSEFSKPPTTRRNDAPVEREAGELCGQRLGRFELLELLGRGGYGAVYRAHDPQLDRDVAIKIPRRDKLVDEHDVQRFLREARAAGGLRHPYIVPVFDAGIVGDRYFIASGFVAGETLRARLKGSRRFTPREAAQLVSHLADALDYAHRQGIVHRDVKPENIIVDASGEPHLLDFGLAHRDEQDVLRTQEGVRMGTPAYMSPEQAAGRSHLSDARTDLWSLGVVLYELLAGCRPFSGETSELMVAILHHEPAPLRKRDPTISRDLETITAKCLAKRPKDRYESCGDLARELECVLRGEPISARSIGPLERAMRWCRRQPALAVAVGTTAVSLLAAAVLGVSLAVYQAHSSEKLAKAAIDLQLKQNETAAALAQVRTARDETDDQRRKAQSQLAGTHLSRARRAFDDGDSAAGQLWLCEALTAAEQAQDDPLARAARLNLAAWYEQTLPLEHLEARAGAALVLAFSPAGDRLLVSHVTTSAQVRLLDPAHQFKETTQFTVNGAIVAVAFSPSGDCVATVNTEGNLELWNAASGVRIGQPIALEKQLFIGRPDDARRLKIPLPGAQAPFSASRGRAHVSFNTDGSLVAAAVQTTMQVVATATAEPRSPQMRESLPIGAIALRGVKNELLAMTNSGCHVWNTQKGELSGNPIEFSPEVTAAAITSDGQVLITAAGSEAHVYATDTGEEIGAPLKHAQPLRSVDVSSLGNLAMTITADNRLHVWELDTGLLRFQPIEIPGQATELASDPAMSPGGDFVATLSTDARSWQVWDTQTGARRGQPLVVRDLSTAVAWSTQQDCLAVASIVGTGRSSNLQVWQVPLQANGSFQPEHPFAGSALAATRDGRLFATTGADDHVRFWEIAPPAGNQALPQPQPALREQPVSIKVPDGARLLCFNPDSHRLAVLDGRGIVQQYAVVSGKPLAQPMTFISAEQRAKVSNFSERHLAYTPDGRTLIVSGGTYPAVAGTLMIPTVTPDFPHQLQVWNAETCQRIGEPILFESPASEGRDIYVGPDSQCLWIHNQRPPLWRIDTAEAITLQAPAEYGIAANQQPIFSPDGIAAMWTSPKLGIKFHEVASGKQIPHPGDIAKHLKPHPRLNISPFVSGLGEMLLGLDDEQQTVLWNVSKQSVVSTQLEIGGGLAEVIVSPSGQRLLVRGRDGSARLFDPGTGQPVGVPLASKRSYLRNAASWARYYDRLVGWSAPFSPDGQVFVTDGAEPNTFQLWDAGTGQPIGPLLRAGPLPFSNNSASLVFSGGGEFLVLFDSLMVQPPRFFPVPRACSGSIDDLRRAIELRSGSRLSSGGDLEPISAFEWAIRGGAPARAPKRPPGSKEPEATSITATTKTKSRPVTGGFFRFPQAEAKILCEDDHLRLSCWNDAALLYVQAIIWEDGDAADGATEQGRVSGDTATLVIDVNADGKPTPQVDRDYTLNPWPNMPGLHYQVQTGQRAWSFLKDDTNGRGAIAYQAIDGQTVRIDSFVIPLAELGRRVGDKLRLAYYAASPKPKLTVNSVGHPSEEEYYSHDLQHATFHEITLSDRPATLELQQLPDGRSAASKPPSP